MQSFRGQGWWRGLTFLVMWFTWLLCGWTCRQQIGKERGDECGRLLWARRVRDTYSPPWPGSLHFGEFFLLLSSQLAGPLKRNGCVINWQEGSQSHLCWMGKSVQPCPSWSHCEDLPLTLVSEQHRSTLQLYRPRLNPGAGTLHSHCSDVSRASYCFSLRDPHSLA